jgi:hypothetical protein
MRGLVLGLSVFFTSFLAFAQTSKTTAVMLEVEANAQDKTITLSWQPDNSASNYQVYRKSKESSSWGTPLTTLAATENEYTDTDVEIGETYEYFIRKIANGFQGSGYALAGIEVPTSRESKMCLLLVDEDLMTGLGGTLDTLKMDIVASGYNLVLESVPSSKTHVEVKEIIDATESAHADLKTVYILGHVAVPYSGQFCNDNYYTVPPDGHGPGQGNHCGAWAADVYYGMDYDRWSDEDSVTDVVNREANKNRPGDLKWDEIRLPGGVQLEIGRVDLSDLPVFSETEVELTKRYIRKVHAYKTGAVKPVNKALVTENFPASFAFSSTAWRSFPTMVGFDQIEEKDYFTTLTDTTYLFAYGTGPGSYTSAGGIGRSSDFVTGNGAMFNLLFGSYFGDWDVRNNFLRSCLASEKGGLTSAWSGRPYWQIHPLAFNESFGYVAKITQNNRNKYAFGVFENAIHIALMGDPTLNLHPVEPVENFVGISSSDKLKAELSWTASTDANVVGYHLYYSHKEDGPYYRANRELITGTSFNDEAPYDGTIYYMIRPVRLEDTKSGSFYNQGYGNIIKVEGLDPLSVQETKLDQVRIHPNPSSGIVQVDMHITSGNGVNVMVFSMDGKLVKQERIQRKGKVQHQLDLSAMPKGVYSIRIGNEVHKKLVLQ